jgi:hypothetical protein
MARPTVSEPAEALYEALGPMTDGDEPNDWPLLKICDALCRAFVEQIWTYVSDTDAGVGWTVALDPARAPAEALPWLGQFVGVEITPVMTEADTRAAIANPAGLRRGTPAAMAEAVMRTLTGSKTVSIDERVGGDAYQLAVTTLPAETPDATITARAILSQKPIGLVIDVDVLAGQTWADLVAGSTDWSDVEATYPDWVDVISTPP